MLKLFLLVSLVAVALTAPSSKLQYEKAPACNREQCQLPNCRCASTEIPGNLTLAETPQFVFFTFDDAVNVANYEIYSDTFYHRLNPDQCPVSVTYFVSHEYTDYSKVHDLYVHNHEIALHSITHTANTPYWQTISVEDLRHEFEDEKKLVARFANISEKAIAGMRLPFLQLSGSNSFRMLKEIGLKYDCSWPTQTYRKPGLWPYTLDYRSNQDCPIGPCPKDSIPEAWVVPMIDWVDQNNIVCAMVDSCVNIPTDEDGLLEWFKENFHNNYKSNKAPFGFYVHAAWFQVGDSHLPAYRRFVDYLQSLPDVYLVNVNTALEWIKNPVPIGSQNWPSCPTVEQSVCNPQTCELRKGNEIRYMRICNEKCPNVYPWINNPYGE